MTKAQLDQVFRTSPPENYQRFFVPAIGKPLAEDLLRECKLQTGERVLDVGCGTGVVTRMAAQAVGKDGRVVGVDINPGMLAVARSATPADMTIEWKESSADALPFGDASFDVVLCQLSLQFMPDRRRALSEMRRVLVPGGRLMLNVPGPADPLFATLADAMERHISPDAARFVHTVFSLNDESEIEALLNGADFTEVDAHAYTRELSLPAPKDFLWQYVGSTPLAAAVAESESAARSALEKDVLAGWAGREQADGLPYRQRIVVASAVR